MLDPFLERVPTPYRARYHLLGSPFSLASNDQRLMRLAAHAFAGLPRHHFPGTAAQLRIRLILRKVDEATDDGLTVGAPVLRTFGWNNVFCATMGPDTCAVISPQTRSGLIVVSERMLDFPYHLRYELLEFVVFMLAARSRSLISLHSACVALNGRGLLLLGDRGAGKSTTGFACVMDGFEFVAEDGIVVCPTTLLTSGLSTFLHLRADSLHFFQAPKLLREILKAPTIVRRSGVEKIEVDMRRTGIRLARSSVEIRAVAFLSAGNTGASSLATLLSRKQSRVELDRTQPYASALPGWQSFARRISSIPAYAVQRGKQPQDVVAALRRILA
jgi:hypothetical protein